MGLGRVVQNIRQEVASKRCQELEGETVLKITNDLAEHLPQIDIAADGRKNVNRNGGAGQRDVDDLAAIGAAVCEDDTRLCAAQLPAIVIPFVLDLAGLFAGQPL